MMQNRIEFEDYLKKHQWKNANEWLFTEIRFLQSKLAFQRIVENVFGVLMAFFTSPAHSLAKMRALQAETREAASSMVLQSVCLTASTKMQKNLHMLHGFMQTQIIAILLPCRDFLILVTI